MIDWLSIGKGLVSLLLSFGAGWAAAVLADATGIKAIASGITAAATYWLGNRQTPVTINKEK